MRNEIFNSGWKDQVMAKSEKHINEAQANVHREPRAESRRGGSHGKGSDVGNESKANLKGTQLGGSRAEGFERPELKGGLGGAVEELGARPLSVQTHHLVCI